MKLQHPWIPAFLRCEVMINLLWEQQDRPLTAAETRRLRVHLFLCKTCKQYRQQLQEACVSNGNGGFRMSDACRKRMKDALDAEMDSER